ncbi:MAG: hypothetical protein HY657_03365 [Acidobacteria bacterium]|nr:hypothetical protein [Acidobacteriota bacterium]
MTLDEIAKRLDNRAGYELITYGEVGLPMFGVYATALVLESQERNCIEEFTLRALSAGLDTSAQIQGILGLPRSIIDTTLADLVRQEALRTASDSDQLLLTERGKQLVGATAVVSPSEQTIWFPFDGLLRRPKWYGGTAFLKPNEAKEQGLPQLKAIPTRGPAVDELSAADVSEVIRLAVGASRGEREVLRVVTIEKRFRQFLPAVALVYRALERDDLQVGFAIDGRISQEHELAFARGGGLERQPIFEGLQEKVRPPIDDVLGGRVAEMVEAAEALRKKAARVTTSRSALDMASLAVVRAQSGAQRAEAAAAEEQARDELAEVEANLQKAPVRPLPVYEHPAILDEAVSSAAKRLLILSPWVRRAVVDDAFLRNLQRACERGVRVSIGFGLGEADLGEKAWDAEARRKLENLSKDVPLLEVRRLGNTHAKVLVKDSEFFVITSFNWLSFRGDPSKPFREEWGTIVRDPILVDDFYAEIMKRFA